uniref:Solute carrier family 25 member 40 n=1 Tax=Arion vulgaris TaxID=1028688 RepID=A0A0B6ZM67_9EUPU
MSSDDDKKTFVSQEGTITAAQHMISACTGAVLTSLMMTPFDVVKIRLQSQAKPSAFTNGNCFLYCNGLMDHLCHCESSKTSSSQWFKRPSHFNGTLDALVKIVRNEGVTSLWSGLPPTLVMAVPATVVYFTSYEKLKIKLNYQENNKKDFWKPLVAGSIARVWAASLISPIEMIRTKMQSKRLTYSQIHVAVKDAVRNNGALSLWKGLGPTLLRDVPFSAMYWTGYETFKRYILATTGHSSLSFYESFGSGAMAGSIAAVITLPFDVIKTRRQIELGEQLIGRLKESTSTWKIIVKIYSDEGFRALFTGLPPRLMKVAPACAIMISTFEYFKHYFASRKQSQQIIDE